MADFHSGEFILPDTVSAAQGIDAKTLFKAFLDNGAAANKQYKGKMLAVKGKVRHIGVDAAKKPFIQLIGGGIFHNVRCFLQDPSHAANIKKGQVIILVGKCHGRFGDVLVKDCLISGGGTPTPPADTGPAPELEKAHDLITAFNTNEINADTRYKGKTFWQTRKTEVITTLNLLKLKFILKRQARSVQ